MTRVLFIGQQPETVDYTDPTLPPGMTADKIHAGIALALRQMTDRGWLAELCLLQPDGTAGTVVERCLHAQAYDCVVIGAGIRLPPRSWRCSRPWSTQSIAPRRAPSSHSILDPRTAPTRRCDGCPILDGQDRMHAELRPTAS